MTIVRNDRRCCKVVVIFSCNRASNWRCNGGVASGPNGDVDSVRHAEARDREHSLYREDFWNEKVCFRYWEDEACKTHTV